MTWKHRQYVGESFEKAVKKYFTTRDPEEWSLPDLCIEIGISTRTFQNYAHDPEMAETCLFAKDRINRKRERMVEKGEGYGNGILFLLRTMGYQDTQQIEVKQDLNVTGSMTLEQYLHDEDEDGEIMA